MGCSHNKCSFCGTYKGERFRFKDQRIIDADIRYAAQNLSFLRRVFLADGDVLIMPQPKLRWILNRIREDLPWIQRVGLYGNAKSILRKSSEELQELRSLGLGIVYLGLESGDPQVLREILKGAGAERMIEAGRRVRAAGIKLSVTVLLGIAGRERSLTHARATGEVLSAMDPNYVGASAGPAGPAALLLEPLGGGLDKARGRVEQGRSAAVFCTPASYQPSWPSPSPGSSAERHLPRERSFFA